MIYSPTVCVIIAAYNAEATIARAIRSALEQPPVTEVIVVDDASPDTTIQAAQHADDGSGRLIMLSQHKNAGPAAARNRALNHSNADWFTILDADDFFLPGRIEALLKYHDQADLIGDNMWQVAEDNIDGPRKGLLEPAPTEPFSVSFEEFVLSNVTRTNRQRQELGFINPLMRGDFLRKHALHYREDMRLGEDYELYTRALGLGARMLIIPNHGYVVVVRSHSLSSVHSEEDLRCFRDCDLNLQKELKLSHRQKAALKAHYHSVNCRYQWRMMILAVKHHRYLSALKILIWEWKAAWYVIKKLAEECVVRATRQRSYPQ